MLISIGKELNSSTTQSSTGINILRRTSVAMNIACQMLGILLLKQPCLPPMRRMELRKKPIVMQV